MQSSAQGDPQSERHDHGWGQDLLGLNVRQALRATWPGPRQPASLPPCGPVGARPPPAPSIPPAQLHGFGGPWARAGVPHRAGSVLPPPVPSPGPGPVGTP